MRIDGVKDGLIENPHQCKFDPGVLECRGAADGSCLSKAQVETARLMYSNVVNPRTKRIIAGLAPGSELGWTDLGWTASARATGLDQFRFIVFGDPAWTIDKFNVDIDVARAEEVDRDIINALDPNLKPFLDRGGKLIAYHGWSDPQISPLNVTHYHRRVLETRRRGENEFRLPAVHGARHGALQRRRRTRHVRHPRRPRAMGRARAGARSDRRIACDQGRRRSHAAVVSRIPQVAAYKGTGSIDEAANFTCKAPYGV